MFTLIYVKCYLFCILFMTQASYMNRPIKHHKVSKHKKSKSLQSNVAVHPFVMIAIAAALTVVVFLIVVYFLRYLK